MKHIVVIFAHPDDEAFGPSGTLLKERYENDARIHLICLTDGGNGTNPDNVDDLAALRCEEWKKAAKLIGATTMHQLGYIDGCLCNTQYHEVASAITDIVRSIVEKAAPSDTIEFMSDDFNGISGHMDHIFATRVAAYVFYAMKAADQRFTRLRLTCIPSSWAPKPNTNWLYMDAGRTDTEIDEIVDARQYADEVFAIMRAHHSQRRDGESHIAARGADVALNHFIVLE